MSSAAPSIPSTKQENNYERLCRLLVGVGWQVLRETFDRVRPPGSLYSVLADPQIHAQLKSLRKKIVLSTPQWIKLYPIIKSSVSSATFDSTLLVVLLRNICGLVPPATGWSNCPLVTDTTLAADIARIQFYRNTVYTHACNMPQLMMQHLVATGRKSKTPWYDWEEHATEMLLMILKMKSWSLNLRDTTKSYSNSGWRMTTALGTN